ncbi:hypothetical protein IT396_03385 [Candidatus Nomurabacteria bacterium]|nr:hypothetical protein [Candidatus Nomurabacteria bacterium]
MEGCKTLVAYVAAPHGGYLKFFRAYPGGTLWVLGADLVSEFSSLTRNLPAPTPEETATMIRSLGIFDQVSVLTKDKLSFVVHSDIVMPDEDVSRVLADAYFPNAQVTFDGRWRLRYDRTATLNKQVPDVDTEVSFTEFDRTFMRSASETAQRSPDWWRQVGSVLVRDGKPLLVSFNQHLPSEQTAYLFGDPRSNFDAGQHIDFSLALHSEVAVLTAAARRGIKTEGCDLYVTTFPCPPCASACISAGLRRLYFAEGYSLVAALETLKAFNVEVIRVQMNNPPTS